MKIKIIGYNQDHVEQTIAEIMNIATVCFSYGRIPTEDEMNDPLNKGRYWFLNKTDNKYEIYSVTNNHSAFIKERGSDFVIIEFHSRYDSDRVRVDALTHLITAFFENTEIV